ncbi:MAG: hypothetical protein N4A65_04980 [Cohaesibacter sp.]|nr:hypothetical protein [Cohaesibacter sp.]
MAETDKRNLQILHAVRTARKFFADQLVSLSVLETAAQEKKLRDDGIFLIAEFFFLLKTNNLTDPDKIKNFAKLHNQYLDDTIKDGDKIRRLGRTAAQLQDGYFSAIGIEKLGENYLRKPPCFDQSDLCRFLIAQFSVESCRRHLKLLRAVKLLEEIKTPYGSLVLHSPGLLETVFSQHLAVLDEALKEI